MARLSKLDREELERVIDGGHYSDQDVIDLYDDYHKSILAQGGIIDGSNLAKLHKGEVVVPLSEMKLYNPVKDGQEITLKLDPERFAAITKSIVNFKITTYNTETVKGRIIDLLNKQCAKGEAKYGHTLDDCPDDKFDWKLMAMEEMIDLLQYQQKEIIRLERLLNP